MTYIIYLNDILIFSNTKEEHKEHVREILERLREVRLFINLKKYEWHTKTIEYLRFIISLEGLTIDPKRVQVI